MHLQDAFRAEERRDRETRHRCADRERVPQASATLGHGRPRRDRAGGALRRIDGNPHASVAREGGHCLLPQRRRFHRWFLLVPVKVDGVVVVSRWRATFCWRRAKCSKPRSWACRWVMGSHVLPRGSKAMKGALLECHAPAADPQRRRDHVCAELECDLLGYHFDGESWELSRTRTTVW